VSSEAATAVLSLDEAVRALQTAYAQPLDPSTLPPRTVARNGPAWLRVLPAIPAGSRYFGAKLMGMAADSRTRGVEYVIVLFDRDTSRIAAFVDGNAVTGYRTAATSAAALDRLAPPGPVRLGVLGSGFEASMHVRAFATVRPLQEVVVFSPTPERRSAFARSVTEELGVSCTVADSPEIAGELFRERATVVLAAARSRGERPILFGDSLRTGTTVVSIGSTVPEQRELDVSVVACSDLIVCDAVEEVIEETGDMLEAARAGLSFRDRCFSLHALLCGELEDARANSRISLFKSVGSGLQDVVVAELVLQRAIEAGQATPLPVSFAHKL
jgi:ornithine cyclodeaminase/alanine dehydrogenase